MLNQKLNLNAQEYKERFLKIYANLPLGIRQEIILTIEDHDQPITWYSTFIEIQNDTPLSKVILEKLVNLKII